MLIDRTSNHKTNRIWGSLRSSLTILPLGCGVPHAHSPTLCSLDSAPDCAALSLTLSRLPRAPARRLRYISRAHFETTVQRECVCVSRITSSVGRGKLIIYFACLVFPANGVGRGGYAVRDLRTSAQSAKSETSCPQISRLTTGSRSCSPVRRHACPHAHVRG